MFLQYSLYVLIMDTQVPVGVVVAAEPCHNLHAKCDRGWTLLGYMDNGLKIPEGQTDSSADDQMADITSAWTFG
jgi:hypothetical protein